MILDDFYFLSDDYYTKYEKYKIMNTRESVNGTTTGRPFFYAIRDNDYPDIYWMIPISSQYNKYQKINEQKLLRYPKGYDGLEFGRIQGKNSVFLIQNLCPTKQEYIVGDYIDKNTGLPVTIQNATIKSNVKKKAKKLITLTKKGIKCTITDAKEIYEDLLLN